ncbi:MAG: DUF642 domain-containing protein [Syntrophobacteraceae bacterium]
MNRLMALAATLLLAALPVLAQADIVSNGDFITSASLSNSGYSAPNEVADTGWFVTTGSIDLIGPLGYWLPPPGRPVGAESVDLDGYNPGGGIQQTLTGLIPGKTYYIAFYLSGNLGNGTQIKTLYVSAGGTTTNYSVDDSIYSPQNETWTVQYFSFTPTTSSTVLIFQSTDQFGSSGPVIAGVHQVSTISIDIEPWFKPNIIDLQLKWVPIPVAIVSTPSFNAPKSVDLDSLTFGHSGNEKSLVFCSSLPVDVNGDKAPDLICFFNTGEAGFQCGDTQGILKGQTKDGTPIEGSDSVKIVPCK